MLIHPNFDPVAIHLGPLAVRWYGLMYLVAFIAAIVVGRLRLRLPYVAAQGWTAQDIDDMLFYGVLGPILGGRLGHVLFLDRKRGVEGKSVDLGVRPIIKKKKRSWSGGAGA